MENRNLGHHTEVPHAAKLVLETIEARGIANDIIAEGPDGGQVIGAGDPHLLRVDIVG